VNACRSRASSIRGLQLKVCRDGAEGRSRDQTDVPCCTGDEGRPLGLGRQGLGPNHQVLLRHNGRGSERLWKRRDETRQVNAGKTNESEPLVEVSKASYWRHQNQALFSGLGGVRETTCFLPGRWPAQRRREPSIGSCVEHGNLSSDAKGDLQVVDPRGAEYRCGVPGADGLVVVMKPGNAGGAKGPGTLAPVCGQPAMGGATQRGIAAGAVNAWQPECKSRMRRESHVRFCEGVGVKSPRPTRPQHSATCLKEQ